MKNKNQLIKEYLKAKKHITNWECIVKFRYTRLSDIIYRLRRDGWSIESKQITKNGTTFVDYIVKKVA